MSRLPRLTRRTIAALLIAVPGGAPALAAEKLEDHFRDDWYLVEVVIFQRPQVQDHAAAEALTRPPAPLPRHLQSFRSPAPQRYAGFDLHPSTRMFLSFPYLDHSLLPAPLETAQLGGEAAEPQPAAGMLQEQPEARPPPQIEPRLASDPLLDFLRELAQFEAALAADSFRWLNPARHTLTGHARRLARRGGFEILLHGRWLQPVPPRDSPQPLYLRAGPRLDATSALEGILEVTLGRYLHFRAALYYTEPLLGQAPLSQPLPPPETLLSATPGQPLRRLSEADFAPAGFMQLRESRRLRSGELHYLDHPKLGVLVKVEPVIPPKSLSDAHVALEEGQ